MKKIKAQWCFIEICVSINNTTLTEQSLTFILRPEMNADTQFRTKRNSSVPFITLYTRGSMTNKNAHDKEQIFKKI